MRVIRFKIGKYRVLFIPAITMWQLDSTSPQTNAPCKSLDLLRIQWKCQTSYSKNLSIKILFFFYLNFTIYDTVKEHEEEMKWKSFEKNWEIHKF